MTARILTPDQRRARTAAPGHKLYLNVHGEWTVTGLAVRPGASLALQLELATAYLREHHGASHVPTRILWIPVVAMDMPTELAGDASVQAGLCPVGTDKVLAFALKLRGGHVMVAAHQRMHLAWPSQVHAGAVVDAVQRSV